MRQVSPRKIYWVAVMFGVLVAAATARAATPPEVIRDANAEGANLYLSGGVVKKIYLTQDGYGAAVTSTYGGMTFDKPGERVQRWATKVLLDRDGEMHGFFLMLRVVNETGRRVAIDRFIDVLHVKTTGAGQQWEKVKTIQEGWNGSIVSAPLQLPNGRIVLPSQDWVPGSKGVPPTGNGYAMTMYSDDGGDTWSRSNRVVSPVYEGYNGANFGACEPSIVQLNDGRLWMLMRTQTGWLYQAFSSDGAVWSKGEPSQFYASTGPPSIIRMPDGRLLLFWNNAVMPDRIDGQGVYAGRDVLHGAISSDDGKTWQGFREVLRDPKRHQSPPRKGDRGTAYPYTVVAQDQKHALVTSGQGGRRQVIRIDPDWLMERRREDDFSQGFEGWSVFKGFGDIERWWRDRTVGPALVEIGEGQGDAGNAMHLRKPDEKVADGAAWNFPAGKRGTLSMRIKLDKGHDGVGISLQDRFFEPTDDNAGKQAIYHLRVAADGRPQQGVQLPADVWLNLQLVWDSEKKRCEVLADGKRLTVLTQMHPCEHGISYLHLRSLSEQVNQAGMLVKRVVAEVE